MTDRTDPDVARRAEATHVGLGQDHGPLRGFARASSSIGSIARSRSRPCGCSRPARPPSKAIDTAMREAGYPLGPFELMDLIGLDVNLAAATAVWDGLGRPERLAPIADPGDGSWPRGDSAARLGAGSIAMTTAVAARPSRWAGPRRTVPHAPAADIVARIEAAITAEAERMAADGIATSRRHRAGPASGRRPPTQPVRGSRTAAPTRPPAALRSTP